MWRTRATGARYGSPRQGRFATMSIRWTCCGGLRYHDAMPKNPIKTSKPAAKPGSGSPPRSRAGRPKVRHGTLTAGDLADAGDDIIERIYQTVFDSVMEQR